jgi:hypothetical protein
MVAFPTRAHAHLSRFPVALPADDASMAAQKAVATDPGLLGAVGGLTPAELRELIGPLPLRAVEGFVLGLYDRVATDIRILGTARLESALVAARRASHEMVVALKLGRLVARLALGASWLEAAGIGPDAVRRLAARTPIEADVHAVRSLYAMHRPTFAELRVRLATSPIWTPAALPTLREAALAAAGLSCAPCASLVRSAVGGRPWGMGEPLSPSKLGSRAGARILVESLRCLGLNTSSLGAGLILLAGLYDAFGKTDETTGARTVRATTPPDARPVVAHDVTTTLRMGE